MYGIVVMLTCPFYVGNDCKKVLSMEGMILFSDLLSPHQICFDNPADDEMMGSDDLALKYHMYMYQLSKCHALFSASRPLSDEEKQQCGWCGDELLNCFNEM